MGRKISKTYGGNRRDYINGAKMSLLGMHGDIDIDKAIDSIKFRAKVDVIDISKINNASKKACLMLDRFGRAYNEIDDIASYYAKYKIVPLGYNDKNNGYPLYASFIKGPLGWDGVFTGTLTQLIERAIEYGNTSLLSEADRAYLKDFDTDIEIRGRGYKEIIRNLKEDIASRGKGECEKATAEQKDLKVEQKDKTNEIDNKIKGIEGLIEDIEADNSIKVTEIKEPEYVSYKSTSKLDDDIYDRLLIKENWRISNKNRLRFYLKSVFERVKYCQGQVSGYVGDGFVLSRDKSKCLVNTGLLDKYCNDIYLLDKTNNESNFHKKDIIIISSKIALVNFGFDKESIMELPNPVRFCSDKSSLIFSGCLDDFDINDEYRLNHIIRERRGRFGDRYKDLTDDVLSDKIRSAIRKSVRIAQRDYKYVVPMYNLEAHKIQYLMPLHFDRSIDEAPELTLVIGEKNGFWCVYTILDTDDAYDNARLLCRPDTNWLTVNKNYPETVNY